jgi:hypothetical protein|nr:MAG TPA: hypothetical protein [Caudoviricetes sp.]
MNVNFTQFDNTEITNLIRNSELYIVDRNSGAITPYACLGAHANTPESGDTLIPLNRFMEAWWLTGTNPNTWRVEEPTHSADELHGVISKSTMVTLSFPTYTQVFTRSNTEQMFEIDVKVL